MTNPKTPKWAEQRNGRPPLLAGSLRPIAAIYQALVERKADAIEDAVTPDGERYTDAHLARDTFALIGYVGNLEAEVARLTTESQQTQARLIRMESSIRGVVDAIDRDILAEQPEVRSLLEDSRSTADVMSERRATEHAQRGIGDSEESA